MRWFRATRGSAAQLRRGLLHYTRRSALQLTLMGLTPHPLLHIVAQAEKDEPGTGFSITPVLKNQKATFVVLVAKDGKVMEPCYDLASGQKK